MSTGKIRVLTTNEPNEYIPIAYGNFRLEQEGIGACSGKGSLVLKLLPLPAYWFTLETDTNIIKDEPARLFGPLPQAVSVNVFQPVKNETGFKYSGFIPNDAIDSGLTVGDPISKCDVVFFKIMNFPRYTGTLIEKGVVKSVSHPMSIQYKDSEAIEWQIVIMEAKNIEEIVRKLDGDAFGGYAITHIGIVKRRDGLSFEFRRSTHLLAPLRDLLTLIRGGWCYPLFITGFENNKVVCQLLPEPRIMPWMKRFFWWRGFEEIPMNRMYAALANGFPDKGWYTRVNNAIGLYVDANHTINVQMGIVGAQAALELLSWMYSDKFEASSSSYAERFVDKGRKERVFKNLRADQRIRWMLEEVCRIPTAIPMEASGVLDHYKSSMKSDENVDGPKIIAYIRNGIIHPTAKDMKKGYEVSLPLLVDTLSLELRYIELILLNLLEYDGSYMDRFSKKLLLVPWVKPTTSPQL